MHMLNLQPSPFLAHKKGHPILGGRRSFRISCTLANISGSLSRFHIPAKHWSLSYIKSSCLSSWYPIFPLSFTKMIFFACLVSNGLERSMMCVLSPSCCSILDTSGCFELYRAMEGVIVRVMEVHSPWLIDRHAVLWFCQSAIWQSGGNVAVSVRRGKLKDGGKCVTREQYDTSRQPEQREAPGDPHTSHRRAGPETCIILAAIT